MTPIAEPASEALTARIVRRWLVIAALVPGALVLASVWRSGFTGRSRHRCSDYLLIAVGVGIAVALLLALLL